jgi:hypothetical protein
MSLAAHYVPAAYLGHFANPGAESARRELLWVVQRGWVEPKCLRVDALAKEKELYSVSDPVAAERKFQEFERTLRAELQQAVNKSPMPDSVARTAAGLLVLNQALQIHVRNPRPALIAGKERIDEYERWAGQLHQTITIGNQFGESNEATLARQLDITEHAVVDASPIERRGLEVELFTARWSWRVLRAAPKAPLYTSDGPVQVYGTDPDEDGNVAGWLIMWPIGPHQLFVAATRSKFAIEAKRLTFRDVGIVNAGTLSYSHRMLFATRPFGREHLETVLNYWAEQEGPVRTNMEEDVWRGGFSRLVDQPSLSFVRKQERSTRG